MNKDVRALVWERSRGMCEFCGLPLQEDSFDFHHRQLKTKVDLPSNGLAVHHFCHIQSPGSIHQNPHVSKFLGFIIPSWIRPEDFPIVPVFLHGGTAWDPGRSDPDRWVCLDNFGNYVPFMVDTPVTNG